MSFSGKSKSNAVSGPKRTAHAARRAVRDEAQRALPKMAEPKSAKTVPPPESMEKIGSETRAKVHLGFDPLRPLPIKTLFGKATLLATAKSAIRTENAETVKKVPTGHNQEIIKEPPAPGMKWSITTASLGPELFARNSNRQRLSSLGRLKLALSVRPDGKGVDVGKLSEFARSALESQMISLFQERMPHLLESHTDPVRALAMLRMYHIPMMCFSLIKDMPKEKDESSHWLGPLASRVHALTRTLCEQRLYRGRRFARGNREDRDALGTWEKEFFKPLFEGSCEEPLFWMSRFDDWQSHAYRSWWYYLSKQSSDIRASTGDRLAAACLGTLAFLNSLPSKWFADWERQLKESPELAKVFQKNARRSRYEPKLPGAGLKTWLIEIWPLVRNYRWNSEQLRRVVQRKFVDSTLRTLDDPVEFKKLCKEIKLRFKVEPGRPPNDHSNARRLPRLAALALAIDGIDTASHQWLAGRWSFPTNKVLR